MVFYSNRAEKGLLTPVIKRMRESQKITPIVVDLMSIPIKPKDYGTTYRHTYRMLGDEKPDLVLCCFDRSEMVFIALAAFHLHIPAAQIHAGDLSQEGTWDDMNRHVISLYADIHFCEGAPSYLRTIKLLETVGRSTKHIYEVGSTAFDDLEIDESLSPKEPYDLVLYNPCTRKPEVTAQEFLKIVNMMNKHVVWIEPNGDPGSEQITYAILDLKAHPPFPLDFFRTVPRSQFFGLMKNCDRAIGNSSAFFLELPFFNKRHIHIGIRNKNRETVQPRIGGSDRIVKIITRFLSEK